MKTTQQAMRPVRIWLVVVCLLILAMVAVGGVTRLTGSGLSMVDWKPILGAVPPFSQAEWQSRFEAYQAFPQFNLVNSNMTLQEFKLIFFWEYVHRLLGRMIGIVFLAPYLFFLARGVVRGKLARSLGVAFVLGGLQGLLGWYMVKSGLIDKPHVSHYRLAAHLMVAFALFAYLLWIFCSLLPRDPDRTPLPPRSGLRWGLIAFGILLALQVVYGAFMAGLKAGFAFNTFPTMLGHWVPPGLMALEPGWQNFVQNTTMIHFIHRGLGWLLGFLALGLWGLSWRGSLEPGPRGLFQLLVAVTAIQFVLGVVTLVLTVPVVVATLHQVTACLLLGVVVALIHALSGGPTLVLEPVAVPVEPEGIGAEAAAVGA